MGMILYCADTLCCQEGIGLDLSARGRELGPEVLTGAGLDPELIPELREKLHREVDAMEVLLDLAA